MRARRASSSRCSRSPAKESSASGPNFPVIRIETSSRVIDTSQRMLAPVIAVQDDSPAAPGPVVMPDSRIRESSAQFTKAVARAHRWFEELTTGSANSMAEIAARENITDNYVSNLIHLAWLPPRQVELLLAGDPEASGSARQSMLSRTAAYLWNSARS
jgi:hypothetical protein